ncbi:hypothetical protein D5086_029015 [Populus alba]|uniref:Uncharacterized protein n=1 Tax=Populus alba TaxID=43335 RepID=A0ACC4ASB1_POPAL
MLAREAQSSTTDRQGPPFVLSSNCIPICLPSFRRPENENVLKAYPFRDNRIESPVAMGTREPPSSLAQGISVQDHIIIA